MMTPLQVRKGVSVEEKMLPKFDYYIDESDSDIVALRRQDGSFVGAFSAMGATRESIAEAAKEDYFKLIEVHASSLNLRENNDQQRKGARRSTA
jgi:hypothetical protein